MTLGEAQICIVLLMFASYGNLGCTNRKLKAKSKSSLDTYIHTCIYGYNGSSQHKLIYLNILCLLFMAIKDVLQNILIKI